ncbi:MAG: hypothetical protein PHY43_08890 [Verrucomicrobiales bacterium]|nr:hypothetical protein [Verrucomicrobiales bacterium]
MLAEKTTIKAICWREDKPEKKLQGVLEFGPTSGAVADLYGHLDDDCFDGKKILERFTLYGLNFKNKPFSLFNSLISGGEINLPGGRSCKISSVFGVVGGHYRSPEEILFKKVEVRFTGLVEWTCMTGIGIKIDENPRSITTTYKILPAIDLGKLGPFSARLEISGNVQPDFHSFNIKENCTFVLEAEQMQPYLAFEEYIYAFQLFLSLAVQHPVRALQIIGNIDKPRENIQDTPVFEDFLIIRKITKSDWEDDKLIPQFLLFNLHDLHPSPAAIFEKFVQRKEKLRAAIDLYFSTIYNDGGLPRVEFLTLAQSLEAYHRAAMPGKYENDETYKAGLRAKFWGVVPTPPDIGADFRAALARKLDFLNEFSLRKRLKELAIKHTDVLQELIGTADSFSGIVSDLRNKLTHPGEGNEMPDKDYRTLIKFSEMMALLLEVCFLDEIGFTKEAIKEIIINRSKRARRIHQGWV